MSLKNIKSKIRSVDKTRTVTKAMEAVSAVKMRKSQKRALDGRAYAASALTILERLSGSIDGLQHPLAEIRKSHSACFVVITSDKGLAGNLNSGVLKAARARMAKLSFQSEQIGIIAIGRKSNEYFVRRGYTVLAKYLNLQDALAQDDIFAITDMLITNHLHARYDETYIVYTNFKSTFEQEAVVRKILPLSLDAVRETVEGIYPVKGKFAPVAGEIEEMVASYTFEPDTKTVLDELVPRLLNIEMYHAFLESKASEHSARMVAMKNASDKAFDMSRELTRVFNKARQAQITREVSEIISGASAD